MPVVGVLAVFVGQVSTQVVLAFVPSQVLEMGFDCSLLHFVSDLLL